MSIATLIRAMSAAGASPEAIAIAVEAIEAASAVDASRRASQAARKQRQRDRMRDSHGTVTGQSRDTPSSPLVPPSLSPTPPISPPYNPPTNPDATLKGASANGLDKLEDQCRQAAGCENSTSPSLFDLSPIRRCLAGGASLEMDILPTLRAMSARRKPIASWKYAEQAIMDAKASREAPAMAGNVTIPQPRGQPPPAKVSNNRRILDALNAMEPHDVTNYASHDGPVQVSTSRPVLDVLHGRQGRTG